jgi:hypothetical protein
MKKPPILSLGFLLLAGDVKASGNLMDFGLQQSVPGNGIENTVQAFIDNFTPNTSVLVTGIQFDTAEAYGAPNGQLDNGQPWDGTLDIRLYTDNGSNYPEFASEVILNCQLVSKTKIGSRSDGWYDYYNYTIAFTTPVSLSANQEYWLGTHLSTNYDRDAVFISYYRKSTADPLLSNFSTNYYQGNFSNTWSHNPNDWSVLNSSYNVAFALEVVPEPSASALLWFGFTTLVLVRQKRRNARFRPNLEYCYA